MSALLAALAHGICEPPSGSQEGARSVRQWSSALSHLPTKRRLDESPECRQLARFTRCHVIQAHIKTYVSDTCGHRSECDAGHIFTEIHRARLGSFISVEPRSRS